MSTYSSVVRERQIAFMVDGVWKSGYIVDKFKDIITTPTYVGYGNGRTSTNRDNVVQKNNPIVVDFYLICDYTDNCLYSVRCNNIQIYDVTIHSNTTDKGEKEVVKVNIEEVLG